MPQIETIESDATRAARLVTFRLIFGALPEQRHLKGTGDREKQIRRRYSYRALSDLD